MLSTKMIGNKIAEARKKIHISQAQLAELLFISPQAVGKWERGESMPDIIIFNRLAEILGVDLNYFSESFISEFQELTLIEKSVSETPEISEKQNKPLSRDMSKMNLTDSDFSGLKNLKEKLSSSNMLNCKFIDSDLSELLLKSNNVNECDFSKSNFDKCQIQKSNLNNNVFIDSSLNEVEFSDNRINECNFSNTDFTKAQFFKSYFSNCNFTAANFTSTKIKFGGVEKCNMDRVVLNDTSFVDSYFTDIVFEGTLENCHFENCGFQNVIFQNATLINNYFKNNKKLKKVQFIDCKADKITYAFLKSNQANLNGITLITI